eukprot:2635431-Pyramimonas_sp.AAC.1
MTDRRAALPPSAKPAHEMCPPSPHLPGLSDLTTRGGGRTRGAISNTYGVANTYDADYDVDSSNGAD